MCGIVGVVRFDGAPVERSLVERMTRTLRHRGPDDEGFLCEPGIAFGHQRLSIIDLKTGHQPMTVGPYTVVFNGEIYNYLELRQQLQLSGRTFATTSDTEVLLQMYAACGPQCVRQLNGIFSFLIYDRERRTLFAARDHFGVKPLYYCRAGNEFLFASEIKALLQHPAVRPALSDDALREYLTFQFVLGDRTLFKGVHKVPPAHAMELELTDGAVKTWSYWEPRFGCDLYHTEAYFVEHTRALLEDSIALQLRSDVPVGTYLSGGLDSSIVTGLAARLGPVTAFTGLFPEGPEFDESVYAREAAHACHATLHEVIPTEEQFIDLLPRLVWHMDEPAAGPGLFPQFIVSRLAAQHVKVVLGGQGGDEVFGGYARYLVAYFEQALKGAIFETNEEQQHVVTLASIVPSLPALREYVPMMRAFWRDGMFDSMDERYFRLIDRSGGQLSLLTPEFRSTYNRDDLFERFASLFNAPDTPSYLGKMTHFDMRTGLPALLHVEDRVSMANSIESRVPLLDYRLVDLVASMPAKFKFRAGELKYLLKRAAGHVVPRRILDRRDKMGFPVPLHKWVQGSSRDFMRDTLLSERARHRGIFDPKGVADQLANEAPFSRQLWGMLNLELWFRQFIDPS